MKNYGTEQLWFNNDKPSKVKNCHVTACFSVVSKGLLCWMSGFFSYLLSENKFLCLLNAKTKTQIS